MVSGTNDRWLQKGVALPLIYEKMEPALMWATGDYIKVIKEDNDAFMYQYDSTGKSSDTKKQTPPPHEFPGQFPELDRSRKSTASEILEAHGFSMRIPRKVIRSTSLGPAEIRDCYETAGYWMAEYINTATLTAMTDGATDVSGTWSPTAAWSETTATPVEDLLDFDEIMDIEGYPFRFTDGFVCKANWYELKKYLTSVDVTDTKQKTMFGVPEISGDSMYIPVVDASIHKVMSGMTHGYMLGLDRNNRGAELHYYNDPKFSQAKVAYETMEDGKKTRKTVNNIGIHFKQYEEEATNDTVMQFWYENKAVVTKAYGLAYSGDQI